MDEVEIAIRRVILARLNQMAIDWLGDHARKMFALGQWSGMLNKIDPGSVHCVSDVAEAQVWSDKAILYLTGYNHGFGSALKHIAPDVDESTPHATRVRGQ